MRGPAYSIPSVDRNSGGMGRAGMEAYETDLSQMPAAPTGYQWSAVPGQLFPQLTKLPNQAAPIEALLLFGAAAAAAYFLVFGHKKPSFSLPAVEG